MTGDSPALLRPPADLAALRRFTAARIFLGRAGAGTPTSAHLGFQLDHARARDAVHSTLDVERLSEGLRRRGLALAHVRSAARDRSEYVRRPDLGRRLDAAALAALDTIECRDAILNPDGTEAEWPTADAIIGNPPFLGGKLMRTGLDDVYVDHLFAAYSGSVPAEADLVCYWFAKAGDEVREGRAQRAGLVATNSIRGGANRRVLDRVREHGTIFEAWDDAERQIYCYNEAFKVPPIRVVAGSNCPG